MSQTITFGVDLTTINCGACGGTYAISEVYREKKYQTGGSWHCPYCEVGWGYSGNSENEKLKRDLAAERARRDQAEAKARVAELETRAARAQTTRAKNATKRLKVRAAAGTCSCCHRTFSQLARHMAHKHPTFAGE
jgi:hypothetical protein